MKHNLLRNFLALVLSGIMLAGVGCKNYDDDIDKINNRLDELYVTVADLDEQIESVRNAIPSLDALNEEVAALRSELDGVKTDVASIDQKLEAIGDVQAKLNELSQELKEYVDGAIQSSEETLRNELATKGAVSELEALIEGIQEDYKAELEEINNKLTALEGTVGELPAVDFSGDIQELKERLAALEGSAADVEALAKRVEALEGIEVLTESDVNTLIESQISEMLDGEPWLGDSLNEAIAAYLTNNGYITNAALNDYATYNETLAKLIAEMENEQSDYAAALIAFIQANQTQIDANELQILVDGNQKKMSELMNEFSERLFALENRIQSLVYVPSSLSETSNRIPVTPAPYIDFGKDGKEYLGNQTLEMTFRVSPASLAKNIADKKKATVSIITRKVSMSSTNSPAFTVESVTASEENEGEFTVKATTAYKFGSDNDETLAIALNIKIAGVTTGSEDEQTTHTGIDYTTSFLGLYPTGWAARINDNLRIVKVDDEGKLVAGLSNGLYSSSLKYNDYSVVNFLEGFDVYYFDGKKYMPLSEMWEGVLESSRSAFDAKKITINSANEKSYKVTAESVQIDEANLPTTDTDLIGDNITSSKVTFTVALGEKSLEIGEAQHKVTVVSNGVETSVPQTAIAWNHTKALSKIYTGNPVDMEPKVTVEHYKEMKPAYTYQMGSIEDFNKFALANQWASYIADNAGEIVDGAYVTLVMNSTPTAENDVQRITPTFYGMTFAEGGEYIAYAKFVHSDKTTTTITIPVTASGAPEISYEISKEVMYVGTSTYTVAENFAEALWNDNYKEAFGSKETFLGVVAAMSATTGDDEAKLAVAGNNINVTFPAEYEFKTYRSTLTLADKSGLEIVIPAEITLKEASAELTPNPLFVTDGRVNAIAEFNADGSRYDVVAQPLGNAYTYQVGEGEQALPGVKVVYEINKELQGDKLDEMAENGQTVPEIDADNKLIWNDWGALELKVDAYLVFTNSNEEVKDSRVTFTVAIDSPYADKEITVATKGNEFELSQGASFKVAQLLTLNSTYQSGEAGKETNTNVFDASTESGLHANLATALGGKVKYETTFSNVNFAFDEATGVITYTGEDSSLKPVSQTIEVKVTYTNNFGVEFAPVTVQIKTK
ncbi:hypothetical protein [uncultured Alistipes sp.]|uniref:hypothetical protein n=1 Tax=uncultured Alistipes sp. TaxID=538949 RepID=UPI0026122359|nr:hypothetical protein [uncultured Alistipes sp.]